MRGQFLSGVGEKRLLRSVVRRVLVYDDRVILVSVSGVIDRRVHRLINTSGRKFIWGLLYYIVVRNEVVGVFGLAVADVDSLVINHFAAIIFRIFLRSMNHD